MGRQALRIPMQSSTTVQISGRVSDPLFDIESASIRTVGMGWGVEAWVGRTYSLGPCGRIHE